MIPTQLDEDELDALAFAADQLVISLELLDSSMRPKRASNSRSSLSHDKQVRTARRGDDCNKASSISVLEAKHPAIHLPIEIIIEILHYVESTPALHALCLVSRLWNEAATPKLYESPQLSFANLNTFASAIAPTVKVPTSRDYTLGQFVKTLDLSSVVFIEHLRILTARLITHTGPSLVSFTAPQKSFSGAALRALRYAENLTHLNLQSCFETINLTELFHIITHSLRKLEVLHLAISSNYGSSAPISTSLTSNKTTKVISPTTFDYPPNLRTLSLCGGISDSTLMSAQLDIPTTLKTLHMSHLPFVSHSATRHYLNRVSPHLTRLSILHPFSRLPHNALNNVLVICPHLVQLAVSVDFVTSRLFDEQNTPDECPLKRIDLDASGALGCELKVRADDVSIALMEGRLKKLTIVRASVKLGWARFEKEAVKDLAALLVSDREGMILEDSDEEEEEEEDDEDEDDESGDEVLEEERDEDKRGNEIEDVAGVWLF